MPRAILLPPFPWLCRNCGRKTVVLSKILYTIKVNHDATLHDVAIKDLEIPICQKCDTKVFTNEVDVQVNAALREQLTLLTPEQLSAAIKRVGMTKREVASLMGFTGGMWAKWVEGSPTMPIQTRVMDNFLRAFFAFPQFRKILQKESRDPNFGLIDYEIPPPQV